jgi:hypothetical protein
VLDRVSERTEAAIERERRRGRSRRALGWASLAASILAAALFIAQAWNQRGVETPGPTRAAEAGAVQPPAPAIPAGIIEILDSPGSADVVEMSVGDVEVVMIFDEAMKI